MKAGAVPQVALLVDTSRSYGRDIVRGVRRYAAEHGPWSLYYEPRDLTSGFPNWLRDWPGDGILSRTGGADLLKQLVATKLPVVELRATKLNHPFPFVGMDNSLIGHVVAEHFRSRGFTQFACCLDESERFFVQRCERFVETVKSWSMTCDVFTIKTRTRRQRWDQHQQELSNWLMKLPKPVGVFAIHDQLGFWVLDAARRAGIPVPEEVAVVGGENDNMLCETASPPLSSVRLRGAAVGYAAARLLDDRMHGRKTKQNILIPPADIVVRQSSDIVAVKDAQVAQALRFIRQHATDDIGVPEVAKAVALSRTTLERRMKATIGRSPGEEINRVRFAAVEKLLSHTDMTLEAIAARAGFAHPQYMAEAFRKRTGQTPGQFRERRKI